MKVLWIANPAVCCLDPMDCASIGASEDMRACPAALACVDHECVVPECSTQGCTVAAPVCNLATDVCESCTANVDCSNFHDQARCDTTTRSCVQCIISSDCGPTLPVCEGHTCRKCELDSECLSGACGIDGSCVPESSIAYVDPAGVDTGTCPRTAPCRTLPYATSRTTAATNHIVMAKATYSLTTAFLLDASATSAQALFIHGGGASLIGASGDQMFIARLPITIRDLELQQATSGGAILQLESTNAASALERVHVRGEVIGISIFGRASLTDVIVDGTAGTMAGINVGAAALVDMNRVTIRGWDICVGTSGMPQLTMKNVVAHNCTTRALDLGTAQGLIEFSTIAYSGADIGSGPRAVSCANAGITVRSSIVWTPGGTRVPLAGCNVVSTIVGPTAIAGASNSDPKFVDGPGGNLQLMTGSPARDAVDNGPMVDVVGNPRPIGPRFDLGAYEGL